MHALLLQVPWRAAAGACGTVTHTSGVNSPTSAARCKVPMSWSMSGGTATYNSFNVADVYFVVDESGSVGFSNFNGYMRPFSKLLLSQLVSAGVYSGGNVVNKGRFGYSQFSWNADPITAAGCNVSNLGSILVLYACMCKYCRYLKDEGNAPIL